MLDLYDKIQDAVGKIQQEFSATPKVGIILGTGLGGLVDEIEIEATIDSLCRVCHASLLDSPAPYR